MQRKGKLMESSRSMHRPVVQVARHARRLALGLLAALCLTGSPANAVTVGLGPDFGLSVGVGCLSTDFFCSLAPNFTLSATAPASGTLTVLPGTLGPGTAALSLLLPSATFTGSFDGITSVVFTNVALVAIGWPVVVTGADITDTASVVGTVTGTFEQFAGAISVGGPQAFNEMSTFSTLSCLPPFAGQCGFIVGSAFPRDLTLSVGQGAAADHDFELTFNLVVPEPATASLFALGLGLSLLARRRSLS